MTPRRRPASRQSGARDICWCPTRGSSPLDEPRLKEWLKARHRGLFIRSYVALAGGLLVAALVLDLGFSALQSRQAHTEDPWLVTTFELMESQLAAVPGPERAALAARLSQS